MLHRHVSFYVTLGQTYFLSTHNAVWRDCRRLRKARGWHGVLVRVRGCDIPPWTLCYSLRRTKRWWIWRGWVFRKGGFVLFGQGKSTPQLWESVHNLCTFTNGVGYQRVDIAPTTRSKRSIFRRCFGRLFNSVCSPKIRRSNERGTVQRSVRMYGQDEAAHTLYIEIRAALVPLVHLV